MGKRLILGNFSETYTQNKIKQNKIKTVVWLIGFTVNQGLNINFLACLVLWIFM